MKTKYILRKVLKNKDFPYQFLMKEVLKTVVKIRGMLYNKTIEIKRSNS